MGETFNQMAIKDTKEDPGEIFAILVSSQFENFT